jgi:multidrug transporter EmrE-like cation transporter
MPSPVSRAVPPVTRVLSFSLAPSIIVVVALVARRALINLMQIACIALILGGIAGLKALSGQQ